MQIPVFQLMPTASHPATEQNWEDARSPLLSPTGYSIHIGKTFKAKQFQLSQSLLVGQKPQALNHLCGPSLGSVQYTHIFLILGSFLAPVDAGLLRTR